MLLFVYTYFICYLLTCLSVFIPLCLPYVFQSCLHDVITTFYLFIHLFTCISPILCFVLLSFSIFPIYLLVLSSILYFVRFLCLFIHHPPCIFSYSVLCTCSYWYIYYFTLIYLSIFLVHCVYFLKCFYLYTYIFIGFFF